MLILDRVHKETARDYAIRVIRENIIQLELAPGAMVSENEISAQLGLSRTPVREALIELSKVGIVEILPQKGSRIALIDYALVEEARFMRLVLECAMVERLCTQGLTDEQYARMSESLRLQEFHIENPIGKRYLHLDDQFHHYLFLFANSEVTYQLEKNFNVHFDRVRNICTNVEPIRESQLVHDHFMLFKHITEGNVEEAKKCITIHLTRYEVDAEYIRQNFASYLSSAAAET